MRNLTMMTDLYQLTMMNGYYVTGKYKDNAVFDLFFRQKGMYNYAVSAGLEQAIDYIENLHFSLEDIQYLRSKKMFDEGFLNYLSGLKFSGDIYSVAEGEIVFPYEPILTVSAPIIEAQLVETALLNIIGHQTLIATKASRVSIAAAGRSTVEFGLRRAQGPDAGIYGARASIIGGCDGTSNVLCGQMFGVAIKGTMAHSWVMSYDNELEAFEQFAKVYPDNCLLLVDTYDTLRSGVPNAIKIFNELKKNGHKPLGIRIDSGDLAYLSKKAREMLDEAGHKDAIIFASSDLDENIIESLISQGACIDSFGVGTKLITSEGNPSMGVVYKMSQIERDGEKVPCMKFSDTIEKMTNPGYKTVFRVYDKKTGKAVADIIALKNEKLEKPLEIIHETEMWKNFTLRDYECRELLVPVFAGGKRIYNCPELEKSVEKRKNELDKFWDEYKRLINPHIYRVNLSEKLFGLKQSFLSKKDGM